MSDTIGLYEILDAAGVIIGGNTEKAKDTARKSVLDFLKRLTEEQKVGSVVFELEDFKMNVGEAENE